MNDKIFIDTNILVYAHDRSSGKKYEISKTIVEKLWVGRNGVLSTQVLQEFFLYCYQKNYFTFKHLKSKGNCRKTFVLANSSK